MNTINWVLLYFTGICILGLAIFAVWFFCYGKKKKELPSKKEEEQPNLRSNLEALRLLYNITQLSKMGLFEDVLRSKTFRNNSEITLDTSEDFFKELGVSVGIEEIIRFHSVISVPKIIPIARELYKNSSNVSEMLTTRDVETNKQIAEIISKLRGHQLRKLRKVFEKNDIHLS